MKMWVIQQLTITEYTFFISTHVRFTNPSHMLEHKVNMNNFKKCFLYTYSFLLILERERRGGEEKH